MFACSRLMIGAIAMAIGLLSLFDCNSSVAVFNPPLDMGDIADLVPGEQVVWPTAELLPSCTVSAQPASNPQAMMYCAAEWKQNQSQNSLNFTFKPAPTDMGSAVCPPLGLNQLYRCSYSCQVTINDLGATNNLELRAATQYTASTNDRQTKRFIFARCPDDQYTTCGNESKVGDQMSFRCPLIPGCKPAEIRFVYETDDCANGNGGGTWEIKNLQVVSK